MLSLYDARYNKKRYDFLKDSIQPDCDYFVPDRILVPTCTHCEYFTVCQDLRNLIQHIEYKKSICGDKNTRSYHRKNKK